MTKSYNRIASQSVERLTALSQGIFAVAMTPMVLGLQVPAMEACKASTICGFTISRCLTDF